MTKAKDNRKMIPECICPYCEFSQSRVAFRKARGSEAVVHACEKCERRMVVDLKYIITTKIITIKLDGEDKKR